MRTIAQALASYGVPKGQKAEACFEDGCTAFGRQWALGVKLCQRHWDEAAARLQRCPGLRGDY